MNQEKENADVFCKAETPNRVKTHRRQQSGHLHDPKKYIAKHTNDIDNWLIGHTDNRLSYIESRFVGTPVIGGWYSKIGSVAPNLTTTSLVSILDTKNHLKNVYLGDFNRQVIEVNRFNVPQEFNEILNSIKDSWYILTLSEDWDMNGGKAPDHISYQNAITFLTNYATYLYSHYGVTLPGPQIDPCADGSIDLLWKERRAQLLINFKPGLDKASYYGDFYHNEDSIKGRISINDTKEYLAVWMKNLAG